MSILSIYQEVNLKKYCRVSVRLGDWNITSRNDCYAENDCADSPDDVDVEEEVVHPYFSLSTGNNDIALLRLTRRVQFTGKISKLPPHTSFIAQYIRLHTPYLFAPFQHHEARARNGYNRRRLGNIEKW